MSDERRLTREAYAAVVDCLSLVNGASVANAGVLNLLHATEAFGAGLRAAGQSHAALSTIQMQALTNALVELRRAPVVAAPAAAATAGYVAGALAYPPGAPVVT